MPERWQRIEELYQAALALPPDARAAFLGDVCDGDPLLKREVESLLDEPASAAGSLHGGAVTPAAQPPADLTGVRLGHYRIISRLGRGGMGEVFLAEDARLGRRVALKVLPPDRRDPDRDDRFLREARAASALNHPNIVTVYDIGDSAAGRFIAMEFIPGSSLRALIATRPPVEETARVVAQAARALASAHAAGIIHRDIKPENIMLRDDGYVKVVDFGLARAPHLAMEDAVTMDALSATASGAGGIVGTVHYMSPEQSVADPLTVATDVFSLGVVLYELLTGRLPIEAHSAISHIAALASRDAIAPSRYAPEVPAALDALALQMLDRHTGRRPTAEEVASRLDALTERPAAHIRAAPRRSGVGREAERRALHAALARVGEGRSRMLLVTGEAGMGKTTLVDDFLAELTTFGERPIVTRGRCSERLAGAEAYLPILEALDNLLHRGGGEAVSRLMKTVAPTWYVQVATAGVETSTMTEQAPAPSQERMKRELGAFFQEISRSQPLVVYLDDLHWADVSTIDMLNYLAARFADMRVLVLATYRPADMALAHHPFLSIKSNLFSRGALEELRLPFLEAADVVRYLALEFPGHDLPAGFAALIHEKTEGNPLFMADLVRYLRDSGAIVEEQGTWVLARSVLDVPRDLPETVRSMIARKIEQLDEQDRRLLIAASVQGHEFDSATVAEAIQMDAAAVEERLDVLEHVHVFVKRGDELEFPDRTLTLKYQFVHVLYQNALYASLQPTRRAALSGQVARALVKRMEPRCDVAHHGADTAAIAGRLAVLFETARDFGASAQYFSMAAQHAVGLFGFREALSLAERGLDALRTLSDDPARQQQELGLQMIKVVALRSTTGWATPEIEQVFTRARQLCQELGDPPQIFPVLWAVALFLLIRGTLRECRDSADELMVNADRSGNPAYLLGAHHMAGVSREFIGDMVESSRLLERARELHDPAQHLAYTAMYGLDPGMIARAMSSRPLWALGYPDRALARARETLALARSQRQPLTLTFALVLIQGIYAYRGDAAEALAIGDEIAALCREYELPQEAEWSRSFQGCALASLGRTAEAIDLLKDTLAVQRSLNTGLARSIFLALMADALRQAGRVEEGLAAVEEGLAHADRMSEGGYVAELHRARGDLLRLTKDEATAEASLRAALEYAQRQQAKSLELRAATSLAKLLHASGRTSEARGVLAPVYEWFTEGFDTADLVVARATLSGIG